MTKERIIRSLELYLQSAIRTANEWEKKCIPGAVGVQMYQTGKIEALKYALALLGELEDRHD